MRIGFDEYGVDIGNGYLKVNDSRSTPWSTPSWLTEVTPNSQFPDLDLSSAHIRYLRGDRPDLVGKEYLVGPGAKGRTRKFLRTVDAGKIEHSLQLVLGGVRLPHDFPAEGGTLHIKRLYVPIPDARRDRDALNDKLGRQHVIEHNGAKVAIGWNEAIAKEEGWGALQYAIRTGLINRSVGNATVDIGCGTTIVSYWDEFGQLNYDARQPFEDKGVNALAELIRSDYRVKDRVGSDPKMHLILKGVESEYCLYGATGQSFQDVFEEKRDFWLTDIMKSAISVLRPFKDELDKILIVGGGAMLFKKPKAGSRIVVCSNPQMANVLGLVGDRKVVQMEDAA